MTETQDKEMISVLLNALRESGNNAPAAASALYAFLCDQPSTDEVIGISWKPTTHHTMQLSKERDAVARALDVAFRSPANPRSHLCRPSSVFADPPQLSPLLSFSLPRPLVRRLCDRQ
jgi:hypothetical protein